MTTLSERTEESGRSETTELSITTLREQLMHRRAALRDEIEDLQAMHASAPPGVSANEVRDAGDDATIREQMLLREAMVDRDAGQLKAIDRALRRIDTGEYGICESCGMEIEVARLKVHPYATRCMPCQSAHERQYASTETSLP